jgi:aminomethyltransferase
VAGVEARTVKRTPLYAAHLEAGAKLVDFAGWEMPVEYDGIRAEHLRVRSSCGVFDVSHMGEIETSGPQALQLLQRLLSNDLEKLALGGAQYSVLCREDGGVLDDLFTYRTAPDRFLTVTNASNHDKDLAWFQAHAGDFDAEVHDSHDGYAMLAVQGPRAREIVQAMADAPLPNRFTTATRLLCGRSALVCGTGYTGEDGVEILCDPADAAALWD